jgi:hypothetical protein
MYDIYKDIDILTEKFFRDCDEFIAKLKSKTPQPEVGKHYGEQPNAEEKEILELDAYLQSGE